ncbi:hypothetical protein D6D04_05278 [Aureobasidium pullulans]|nr:hypothetical protein D6D04_05278 [Aureobasidium pullulans]
MRHNLDMKPKATSKKNKSTSQRLITVMNDPNRARILAKLELNQVLHELEWCLLTKKTRSRPKPYIESKTERGLMKVSRVADLEKLSERSPYILHRATTSLGPGHTNGSTTSGRFAPGAADKRHTGDEIDFAQMHTSISDIPLGVIRPMLGWHLLWKDRTLDELLSWTSSYVFAMVHLYLRHLDGQEAGYITTINRTRATRPGAGRYKQASEKIAEQQRFHHALDLCNKFKIFLHEWSRDPKNLWDLWGLHPRRFTHEYITQGLVAYPEDDILQHASFGDLVTAGIFKLVPELKVPVKSMAAGLYTFLRWLRTTLYKDVWRTTEHELKIAEKMAWLHTRLPPGEKKEENRPHLWALLNFLTFRKREAGDEMFQKLIRGLGYTRKSPQIKPENNFADWVTGEDLEEGLHPGFEEMYSNLPELHSLYHLAVDVQAVVGGQALSALILKESLSENPLPEEFGKKTDEDYDEGCNPSKIAKTIADQEIKRKCGLSCGCSIWGPRKKRGLDPDNTDDTTDKVGAARSRKRRRALEALELQEGQAQSKRSLESIGGTGQTETLRRLTACEKHEKEQAHRSQLEKQTVLAKTRAVMQASRLARS